jgi:hypothetical protein
MGSKSMLLRAPLSLRPAKNRQVWSASFVPKWRVTGTIASPWRYDAAAADAIRLDNLRRTAVLRYASWAGCLFDFAGGSVTLRSRLFRLRKRRDRPISDFSGL